MLIKEQIYLFISLSVIIYIISYLSYRFIESPIRYSTLVSTSVVVWVYLGVTCVFYVSISWPIYSQGLVDEQPQITAAINDWSHPGNLHSTSINQYFKYDLEQPIKVLFFGDSQIGRAHV